MKKLYSRRKTAASVMAVVSLSLMSLSVDANESEDTSIALPTPPREEPEFGLEQSVGAGFSSNRGVMAIYRIDARGDFWSLNNDFAVILDRLALTVGHRFEVTEFFSVAAEAPVTLDWQIPEHFTLGYASRGKINVHNRRNPRDERPGCSLWAEAVVQANGRDGVSERIASIASDPLSSSPSSRYRAGGITGITYFNEFLTPSLSVTKFYDLGSPTPTDVIVSGSIAHNWSSRERTTKLSITASVVSSQVLPKPQDQRHLTDVPDTSTRFSIEQGWDRWMGRIEYSKGGSAVMIGYRI